MPANKVEILLNSSTVKTVWENKAVSIEPPISEEDSKQSFSTKMADSNPYLGIDRLHHEGLTGEGIKIGVIDTGIDYNHPDLADAYVRGYDFVDNDNDPMETTYEDWEKTRKPEFVSGHAYYTQHGTHVAGIIAGQGRNNSDYSTTGVAPDADIYGYRVLGPYGGGTTENVLKGIDQAVKDGMDIINLSLGASINDPYFPTSVAVNNAVISGVTTVVAAGNSGDEAYTLGSPASSALALTVGASDVPLDLVTYEGQLASHSVNLQIIGKHYSDKLEDFEGQKLPILEVGLGKSSDYTGKNVEGKIALVSRGEISINDKIKYAKLNGAEAIFIYNNEEGHIPYYLGENKDFIPTFSLSKSDGEALLEKLSTTDEFLFGKIGSITTEGNRLADFSSRGPSRTNYDIKPEVTAPGVGVQSTVPSYMVNPEDMDNYEYAYQRLSGTSMAAPQVAGMAALLLESDPDLQPEDVKTIFMNTADPLNGDYSVFEVGAGRVDPYEAIHSSMKFQVVDETITIDSREKVLIDEKTGGISFGTQYNDGKHTRDLRTIEVSNNGSEKKVFTGKVEFTNHSLDANKNGVQVGFKDKLSVNAGKTKKTNAFVIVPKTAEHGLYEGYMTYENVENPDETYQVPFSIRVVEEGFDFLQFDKQVLTINSGYYFGAFPVATFGFQLNTDVERIDVVLADGKTGEDIGYVGNFEGRELQVGIPYGLYGYGGEYYSFTGDKDYPIHFKQKIAEHGHYKLKFIATNEKGRTFTEVEDIFVDNNKPELKTSIDEKLVYEFKEGQKNYPISGTLIDEDVKDIQAAGIDISQADNYIYEYLYINAPDYRIFPNSDGSFEMDIPLVKPTINSVRLDGLDAATNKTIRKAYNLVPEGTSYMTGTYDKKSAKPGDIVTFTMTANNVKQLKEANFTLYYGNSMEITDVKKNTALASYGDNVELKTDLSIGSYSNAKVNITFNGDQELTGDLPLFDVKLKVTDKKLTQYAGFYSTSNRYIDVNGTTVPAQGFIEGLKMYNQKGNISGAFVGQGFLKPDTSVDFSRDYSQVGAAVKLISPDGTEYTSDISKRAGFRFTNLPINEDPYTLVIDIPGHFKYFEKIMISNDADGQLSSVVKSTTAFTYAGDLNQDDVIDVLDAISMQERWKSNDRSADINYDGIVDEKDFSYIEENYLMRNHTLDELKEAVEIYKGKTLDKVKEELGLTN
ncbi:S8 family serine peptidase [Rossellomorea sp. BNER]|nr:S8 family serine peptidase [Rossellomorea sp. BNER]